MGDLLMYLGRDVEPGCWSGTLMGIVDIGSTTFQPDQLGIAPKATATVNEIAYWIVHPSNVSQAVPHDPPLSFERSVDRASDTSLAVLSFPHDVKTYLISQLSQKGRGEVRTHRSSGIISMKDQDVDRSVSRE